MIVRLVKRPWFTQIKNSLTFFVITSQNIILEEMKRAIEKPAPPFKTDTIEKVASKVFQKFIVYKQIGKDNSSQNKKYTFKMQLTLHLQLWWKGLLPWHLVSEEVLTPPRNNKMDLVNVLVLKRKTNTRSSLVKTKDQKFYILFSFIDISKYGFHKFVQQA